MLGMGAARRGFTVWDNRETNVRLDARDKDFGEVNLAFVLSFRRMSKLPIDR